MTTLAELGIDLRPAVNGLLNGIWTIGDGDSRMVKMEEYVRCLEEERGKIDAFKRELPLCMLILTDVIDALKEEVMHCRGEAGSGRPVLEQFMPIKSKAEDDGGARKPDKDSKDKMNWMSSAQLWSDSSTDDNSHSNNNTGRSKRDEDERSGEADRQSESHDPFAERKYTCGGGGAFRPFKGIPGEARKEEKETAAPLPDLSLLTPEFNGSRDVSLIPEEHRSCGSSSVGKTSLVSPSSNAQLNHLTQQQQQQQQGPRKARRCWSPELHRRFVNALQQLGGSQFATPKQIRELMKVDGLTNDEVKSHLQKYRLHTRRLAPSSGSLNQPVVVLGGSWVSSSDQCTGAKPSDSQLGSPQGPLQLASATRGISLTGVDSCEDEDGKSESYSWRGNSQRSGEEETE